MAADRTYSFRADACFGERLRRSREDFEAFSADAALSAHITREFEVALLRRLRRLPADAPESAFVRALSEAFVSVTERTRRDEDLADEYEAFAREDKDWNPVRATTGTT